MKFDVSCIFSVSMKPHMFHYTKLRKPCTFHQLSCGLKFLSWIINSKHLRDCLLAWDTKYNKKHNTIIKINARTIKTDSPDEGSTDTIDTVRCFTNETGIHEYNPNLSNSVLQTVSLRKVIWVILIPRQIYKHFSLFLSVHFECVWNKSLLLLLEVGCYQA